MKKSLEATRTRHHRIVNNELIIKYFVDNIINTIQITTKVHFHFY